MPAIARQIDHLKMFINSACYTSYVTLECTENLNQKALIEFEPTPYCCCQSMCINIRVIVIGVKDALIDLVIFTFDLSTQNHIRLTSSISQAHSL